MRFDTLDLRAIGPFRGVEIDLSAGDRGLHLVFGPNEAGKSSALRAVRDLLFDFDRQTRAAFERKSSELFVGATLADESGGRLAFLRGKRDKQKLFEPDGRTPLDNTALARFLGNISATAYDSLFALDHARLREGGGEILKGKGDLGPYSQGYSGIHTTPREHARFCYLALHEGEWAGKPVAPSGHYDFAWTGTKAKPDYGAQWWLAKRFEKAGAPKDFVATLGAFNNDGFVVPSLDLVFVRLGDSRKFPKDFERRLVEKVLAAVKPGKAKE